MDIEQILKQVNEVFREILETEEIEIDRSTSAQDIPEWDSLVHIQLIYAVERKFNIRFTAKEIGNYRNVGEMCDGIFDKIKES